MGAGLEVRAHRPGEETQVLDLFRQSYGREMSQDYWAWRFRNGPAGPAVIYLAWDGDTLVAHYAVTSVTVRIQGRDWPTGLSGTTMTHPEYQGRGLFPLLARATYDRMAEAGMAAVWGFPNSLSHRGFVRDLHWADIYEVPTLRLRLEGQLRLPSSGDEVVELAAFDARFDRLWAQVHDDQAVAVKRDRDYLQWRYVDIPTERYHILAWINGPDLQGYAVFKRYKDELQVVDLLTVPGVEVGLALVVRVAYVGLQEGASSVSLWLNVTHPLHLALERAGFANGEPVTYFGALALQPELSMGDLYDYGSWYLMMGDSDVF